MIIIKTKSEAEKRVMELFFEKIKIEAALGENQRHLGYSRIYNERRTKLEKRLQRVKALLSGEPIEIEAPKEIQQFFVTITE